MDVTQLDDASLGRMVSSGYMTPQQAQQIISARPAPLAATGGGNNDGAGGGDTVPYSSAGGGMSGAAPPPDTPPPEPAAPAPAAPAGTPAEGPQQQAARELREQQARDTAYSGGGPKPLVVNTSTGGAPDARAQPGSLGAPAPVGPAPQFAGVGGLPAASRAQIAALRGQSDASSQAVVNANAVTQQRLSDAASATSDQEWGTKSALATLQDETAAIQARQATHMQIAQDHVDGVDAQIKQQIAALQAQKIDPEHYWKEKGTAQRILAGIGTTLGALGAGMPHSGLNGQNFALQIVNKAVDDDIKSQQDDLANKWRAVAQGHELAKDKWARDTFIADQMDKEKIAANAKAQNMIATYGASTSSADAQQKLAGLGAQIEGQNDQIRQGMIARRLQVLSASGAPSSALTLQAYQKYAKDRLEKGEQPIAAEDWLRVMSGKGGGALGSDPLGGVPEKDRGAAREELGKRAEYDATMQRLTSLGNAAIDPHANPLERARRRDAYNASVIMAHEKFGAPGRSADAVKESAAPMLLNANPLANDAERVGNVGKLLPQPATPLLDAYKPRPSAGAPVALPPGARRVSP